MLNLFRRIVPFVLLAIMLLATARYIVFVSVVSVKKVEFIKLALHPNATSQQITMERAALYKDQKGIDWRERNSEVVLEGKFYEVVSIEQNGDLCTVSLAEDIGENHFFDQFFYSEGSSDDAYGFEFTGLEEMNFVLPGFQIKHFNCVKEIEHFTFYVQKEIPSLFFRIIKPPELNTFF